MNLEINSLSFIPNAYCLLDNNYFVICKCNDESIQYTVLDLTGLIRSSPVQSSLPGITHTMHQALWPTDYLVLGLDHEPKNPKNLEAFLFRGIFGRKARKSG